MIELQHVSKSFGSFTAVRDFSLTIEKGEFFALLGGSGCGKTTVLRMLAGFVTPTSGRILVDGVDVTDWPPYRRPLNMMFQSYALFPHMTVAGNIGYGLRYERMTTRDRQERVDAMLDLVQLGGLARRKPHQLSGGQKQRVALARALARQPKVLLLDEPLAALDKKLREQTQLELSRIQREIGITFLVVTHDQAEALALATRIAVMDAGECRQIDSPRQIYEHPGSAFVADFIGAMNRIGGVVVNRKADRLVVNANAISTPLIVSSSRAAEADTIQLAIRPEKISLQRLPPPSPPDNLIRGRIVDVAYFGKDSLYVVAVDGGATLRVYRLNDERSLGDPLFAKQSDDIWLGFPADALIHLAD